MEKVAEPVARHFETSPEMELSVLIVLDLPQPDLSFLITGTPSAPSAANPSEGTLREAAARTMALLEDVHRDSCRLLPSAGSIVASINRDELHSLARSPDVQEIVLNDSLS